MVTYISHPQILSSLGGPLVAAHLSVSRFDDSKNAFVPYSSAAVPANIGMNASGGYELALPAGTYELEARAPGYDSVTHTIVLERTDIIDESFTLERSKGFLDYLRSLLDRIKNVL